ncbi:hypothetical protein G4V62_12570 [Bacillaceae bacterium SIJ1]|uniref:DUF6624 domain-containing protein n=1 Tax=Litoribacterium kuwaitense TaxID=1398745 RepID=UPI0013EC99FD|nr:DUF6624 domain-containing protein [Litoribacterium kuwaitense]NGP45747.1 hypothetical protein [Litoribacterium kuwaitense]
MNSEFRQQLLQMQKQDLEVRERLLNAGELNRGYHPEMKSVHDDHQARLASLIEIHGFPTISLVGEDGHRAAWLIIQHSISHPSFLKEMLAQMKAFGRHQVNRTYVPYLDDRIHFYERAPQKYGTQFDYALDGVMRCWLLADAENVDLYRREVGLSPVEAVKAQMAKESKSVTVAEARAMRQEMEDWLIETGWCHEDDRTV